MIRRTPKGTNTTAPFLTTSLMILITIAFTPNPDLQAQNTRHVATNGTDMGNTCTTLDNPCRTIAHAIGLAVAGDIVDIADGIYTEPDGLVIDKSLTLHGAGQDNITIIQAHEEPGEATSRVITIDGEYDIEITDLTIRHGNTTGSFPDNLGGGLFNNGSTLSVTNVTFTANTASLGGGISNQGGATLSLTNVIVSENEADVNGGGLDNTGSSSATLTNVTFTRNMANANGTVSFGGGGGIYNNTANLSLTNVDFIENKCSSCWGGGLWNGDIGRLVTLENVTFINNIATNGGGMNNNNGSPTLTNVDFIGNSAGNGGGMNNNSGSPTLTNVTFRSDTASVSGGGLFVIFGSPALENVLFEQNHALGTEQDQGGGGIYVEEGTPTLTDVEFVENTAVRGGGMRINDGEAELQDIHFQDNTAESSGGGMYNSSSSLAIENVLFEENHAAGTEQDQGGGGMFSTGDDVSPVLTNVRFIENTAVRGGGMRINGGEAELRNIHFQDNMAEDFGGGIYNANSDPMLTDVTFSDNGAGSSGGGIYNANSDPTLSDVTFSGNGTGSSGGGIYNSFSDPTLTNVTLSDNSAEGFGGGMYNTGSSPTLTNVTFSGNWAEVRGGGIFNTNGFSTLTNTIVWDNSTDTGFGDEIVIDLSLPAGANISHSLIGGGCPDGANCTEVIDADPRFTDPNDPDGADDIFGTSDDGLRLLAFSPAVNAGDPGTDLSLFPGGPDDPVDLAGEPRVFPGNTEIIDMGAYEFQGDGLEFATSVKLTEAGGEGWRMLTSPVVDETYGRFLEPLWTQGVPGADYSDGRDPNVYRFDPSSNDWSTDGLSLVDEADNEIGPGTGFIVYVFADDDYDGPEEGGFPKFLESTGDWLPLDGSFSYSDLGFNNDDPDNSYFLLGNPHPIPLDFCAFDEANIATSIDIWDPAANGGNGNYEPLSCSGGDDVHIAPFQAFWVRTTAANPTLEIPTDAYLTGSVEGFFKQQIAEERSAKSGKDFADLVVSFHLRSLDETFTNTTRILLNENASAGLDEQDGLKRSPEGLASRWLNFYSMDSDGRAYALQSLPQDVGDLSSEALAQEGKRSIPLDIETTEAGSFTLTWELPELPLSYSLRDNRSGKVIKLREGGNYRFEIETSQPSKGSEPLEGSGEYTHPMSVPAPDNIVNSMTHRMSSGAEPRFELLIAAEGVDGLAELGDLPETYELGQNYPNPFNPSTVISYQLPASSQVRLEVYDMLGRRVATLVDEQVAAGRHQVNFDADHLSSGVYLYRLTTRGTNGANQIFTKKLTLIK